MGFFRREGASAGSSPDAKTLGSLREAGSDLSKPHEIEHFLYVPNPAGAAAAAARAGEAGFAVDVRPAAKTTHGVWLVQATRRDVPSAGRIAEMRAFFEGIAEEVGGDYDGWGAQVER